MGGCTGSSSLSGLVIGVLLVSALVDDCTGPLVDVKKWLDNQESEAELNLRAECR